MTDDLTRTDIPNNADSESDLPLRQSRAGQFRESRRNTLSLFLPALLLIALGAFYLLKPLEIPPALLMAVMFGCIGLSLILRFILKGRQESGLGFIGALIVVWVLVAGVFVAGWFPIEQGWPLFIAAVGVPFLVIGTLGRNGEHRLMFPGLLFLWAGAVALVFTLQLISGDILRVAAGAWPILLVLLALAVVPRIFGTNA